MTTKQNTREQITARVEEELDAMFVRLAKDWQLSSGDVEPLAELKWREETLPEVCRFVVSWYFGNQSYSEEDEGGVMRTSTAADCGLPLEFLAAVADELNGRGIEASVEYPGMLAFRAHGRTWLTGLTGLHVNDTEGDSLPGDEALVALEQRGEITLDEYVASLLAVIASVTDNNNSG